jgi:adenylate kinase
VNWLPELRKETAVLVTGTPGTGKTTISRLLAKKLRASYVNPRILLRREGIDYVYDMKRRTRVVSLKRLDQALGKYAARADRGMVIDSHIALETGSLPRLARAIVLRCDPVILERRLKRKRWSKSKIGENLLAEILDICLWDAVRSYGWNRILEIDTTGKRPHYVIQLVMRDLKKRRIQERSKVDWLSSLKRRRILSNYVNEGRN